MPPKIVHSFTKQLALKIVTIELIQRNNLSTTVFMFPNLLFPFVSLITIKIKLFPRIH